MSNPNNKLGQWILRKVFELPVGTVVSYDLLRKLNIDCVVFEKITNGKYKADFGVLGTYEKMYGIEDSEDITINEGMIN